MPGLVPGIHVLTSVKPRKTWMAGTSPAMTLDPPLQNAVVRSDDIA
jgi:hypothetical protein